MMFRDKRLLVITHTYHSFVKDQVELLAPHFAQVTVLVRYKPIAEIATLFPIDAFQRHMRAAALDLHNLPGNVRVIPVPLLYLPMDRCYKRLGEQHYRAVEKVIEREKLQFDLIHAHFAWSAGYVGARLREKYKKPFVLTAHRYGVTELPFRDEEWRGKIESVLNSADQIITVSQSNQACIEQLNVRTPTRIIPNGFKDDLFYPQDPIQCRKTLHLPLDRQIVLTVGYLEEKKGQEYLIDAIGQIAESREDILALIVGSGELKKKLQGQINTLGLQGHVQLVGGKPHHEIPLWMNAADLFVLPSLRESFGVVQVEAMACGKPIVATVNGGSEEILTSDELGTLVEAGNVKQLASSIKQAIEQSWNNEAIAKYAHQFTWSHIVEQITGIYALHLSSVDEHDKPI